MTVLVVRAEEGATDFSGVTGLECISYKDFGSLIEVSPTIVTTDI